MKSEKQAKLETESVLLFVIRDLTQRGDKPVSKIEECKEKDMDDKSTTDKENLYELYLNRDPWLVSLSQHRIGKTISKLYSIFLVFYVYMYIYP